jgi:hypothetical protein
MPVRLSIISGYRPLAAALFLAVGYCLVASTRADAEDFGPGASLPACVGYWPEARYRAYGYDHLVHVQNTCSRDATCTIATNVNPQSMQVTVVSGTQVELITWIGSPAREFTPVVSCSVR